jgi:hypothetical protein
MEEYTTPNRPIIEQQLEQYGMEIKNLMTYYPCLREVCKGLEPAAYPAALFASACFLGTLLTRCTYRFYDRPEELRRLNYGIYVIGDPGSGKSFTTRLYNLLAAPIIRVSKEGQNAVNRYKRKYSEWEHGGQKGDGPKKPKALIRTHPARTSNKVFIEDMNNAIDMVEGQEMHLHLLSYDTELDNTIRNQGNAWNNKNYMELKAFHNEEDGECFISDNLYPSFNVYWNYVYTGTPMALSAKVNQRNIGTGLATRLAAIPMPSTHFKMLERETLNDLTMEPEEDKVLRIWAERLDKEYGELPIEKLVNECYEWTARRMADAEDDDSKADELMCKRVAYYGINVSVPFIMMRHWDEWKQHGTLTIDDTDLWFCQLICNIQYCCQHYFFGNLWENYFTMNKMATKAVLHEKHYSKKMKQRYRQLGNNFASYNLVESFGIKQRNAEKIIERWKNEGYIRKVGNMWYTKVLTELM